MGDSLRAGIIGHTGRGNYGHDLDVAYQGVSDVEVVAVADPDPDGLEAAGVRTGAHRLYADYREMLEAEDLDLVNVCPRRVDRHAELVIAAAESGAKGIMCEKPLARTLAEADSMLDACRRNGVRMAVAHRRANAYEQHTKKLMDEGAIGDIRVIRSRGKADHRSGALDLMVLGTHVLDSMRYLAGSDVAWAHGHVTQDGREVSAHDIREGDEGVGLLAGNGVAAYYAFRNGITGHFESHPSDQSSNISSRWFGLEIYGTKGIISLRNSFAGEMYIYPHGQWISGDVDARWKRVVLDDWDKGPDGKVRSAQEHTHPNKQWIARELIDAVREDRDVLKVSSGEDARAALEMIMAVHESQRLRARVSFPLENRENPYRTWLDARE